MLTFFVNLIQKKHSVKPFLGLIFILSFILVLSIDQFLKFKIRMQNGVFLCNNGVSFGINLPNTFFWLILSLFLLTILIFYLKKVIFSFFPLFMGFSLIFGGALSNMLDRYYSDCIIDLFYTPFKFLPVFNFADIAIFLGALFLFWGFYKKSLF